MLKLKLNKEETRAIGILLDNAHEVCRCGCVYSEMSRSRKSCDECHFTLTVEKLIERINEENN